eukprot:6079702-Lingulodinium_polyedra.AAC.1
MTIHELILTLAARGWELVVHSKRGRPRPFRRSAADEEGEKRYYCKRGAKTLGIWYLQACVGFRDWRLPAEELEHFRGEAYYRSL